MGETSDQGKAEGPRINIVISSVKIIPRNGIYIFLWFEFLSKRRFDLRLDYSSDAGFGVQKVFWESNSGGQAFQGVWEGFGGNLDFGGISVAQLLDICHQLRL